jgi:hypothetical protein
MVLAMRKHFNPVAIGGLVLYGASLAVLLRNKNFEPGGALIVLVFFGIIFPALAWLTTLRAVPLSILVHPTAREMFVLITCIVTLSVYLIGGPQRINNYLPQTWIDSPQIKFFITLTKKLIAFALIPFGIFRFAFGYRLRDFGIQEEGLRALCRNPFANGSRGWRCVGGFSISSRERRSPDSTRQIHRSPTVTICAHSVAGGESLFHAASGNSDAPWSIARVVERGRYSCRGWKGCASEVHEAGRDAKVLAWERLQILLLKDRNNFGLDWLSGDFDVFVRNVNVNF